MWVQVVHSGRSTLGYRQRPGLHPRGLTDPNVVALVHLGSSNLFLQPSSINRDDEPAVAQLRVAQGTVAVVRDGKKEGSRNGQE